MYQTRPVTVVAVDRRTLTNSSDPSGQCRPASPCFRPVEERHPNVADRAPDAAPDGWLGLSTCVVGTQKSTDSDVSYRSLPGICRSLKMERLPAAIPGFTDAGVARVWDASHRRSPDCLRELRPASELALYSIRKRNGRPMRGDCGGLAYPWYTPPASTLNDQLSGNQQSRVKSV